MSCNSNQVSASLLQLTELNNAGIRLT